MLVGSLDHFHRSSRRVVSLAADGPAEPNAVAVWIEQYVCRVGQGWEAAAPEVRLKVYEGSVTVTHEEMAAALAVVVELYDTIDQEAAKR